MPQMQIRSQESGGRKARNCLNKLVGELLVVAELNLEGISYSGFGAFYPRKANCPTRNWGLV